ncbi:MAG: beta-galactosidase/beta-glucuronidase [Planctomycetota bacterium]|nr:beta-galactosidase/beta-glucuronidase [Planctomycetota bacterium]
MIQLTIRSAISLVLVNLAISCPALAADWKPANGPLMTRWAKDVKPDNVLPEYPRPQLARRDWQNLNGLWQFAIGKEGDTPPVGKTLTDQILVPFPVESALSGVMKRADRLWYRRTFTVPKTWAGKRTLLHFGAVDWETQVWINGKDLGSHQGGYDPFTFDVTDALKPDGDQEVLVRVFDPTDKGPQPRGKQVSKPEGIYYTPTTGIWQTVWIEPVPDTTRITGLKVSGGPADPSVSIIPLWTGGPREGMTIVATAFDGDREVGRTSVPLGTTRFLPLTLSAPARPWTPESPFLYDLKVEIKKGDVVVDSVSSYFGLRTIAIQKDDKGVNRIALNGKPIFQVGPLDQGFWPDGLYTAPTDEALKYDIEITKKLGFNMTRKHVKVEPDRWYYWCDKLGLLVWQDMPSGERSISPNDPDLKRSPESAQIYETELKAMIDNLYSHPSIIMWVVFNEGWGQFDTKRIADWTKAYDRSRIVDAASGWADRAGVGDLHDLHAYPRPAAPPLEPRRAGVLGEFGGLSLGVDGHTWTDKIWGYAGTASQTDLTRKYERLLQEAWEMKGARGLNAAVYTQITDVETEANGLLTYDREVVKVDLDRVNAVNRGNFSRVPVTRVVEPTSMEKGLLWNYTFDKPSKTWFAPDFDASSWKEGPGVFGTEGTPGAVVRTT